MDRKQLANYFLEKPHSKMDYPFGDDVEVYKINGKMFGLIGDHNGYTMINLKCDPTESLALQDIFPKTVTPAYHMNKKHWISVYLNGQIPVGEVQRLIDNSFNLVVKGMPKKMQQAFLLHC
ncbi:MmcQ/YjbR family DNA-binding protein [Catenovulum sp. SM1970]|uniref:MmcQ/YjbR family DNA-binding protein n=1 Tax=Marinifaba aquimaris TaxID=2741323 RepID=UPI00157252C2|nr:MmcQ/YjbR family DNA-binding protein [Marinifaba aquimaris]NTS75760.1 MmcQ/YjbR family DNA-binding protein [Marinifaba aquimaris]